MVAIRNFACDDPLLERRVIIASDPNSKKHVTFCNIESQAEKKRISYTHDKNNFKIAPIYTNLDARNRKPHVIEECRRRITILARRLGRRFSTKHIEEMSQEERKILFAICENPDFKKIIYHDRESGGRRRRSDGLEAAVCFTMATIIDRCHLHKMAVGDYDNKNKFRYIDYNKLIEDCSTDEFTITKRRFLLAIKLLKNLGIITVHSEFKESDWLGIKRTRTINIKISVTEKIFKILGVYEEFLIDREKKSIEFYKKEKKLDERYNRLISYAVKENINKVVNTTKKVVNKVSNVASAVSTLVKNFTNTPVNPISKTFKARTPEITRGIADYHHQLISNGVEPSKATKLVRERYAEYYPPDNPK